MPSDVEHDVRNYHNLTPAQRAALIGLVVREGGPARARAMRQAIPASARRLWTAMVRGFDGVRPLGVVVRDGAVRAWQRHQQRRARQAAAAQLYAMDDHALKDIGVCRSEIEFVVSSNGDPTRRFSGGRSVSNARSVKSPSLPPARRADAPLVLRKVRLR